MLFRRDGLIAGGDGIRTCMGLFLSSSRFWLFAGSLFGAGKPFFVPSPAIRFAERAERGQGIETVAKLGGLPPSDACVSQRLRPEHASDDELRRGFLHSFGIWAVPPLMIRGELAIECSFVPQTCMR